MTIHITPKVTILTFSLATFGLGSALLSIVIWQAWNMPIKKVIITGELNNTTKQEILSNLKPSLCNGFWKTSLKNIHTNLKELAWIKSAKLIKKWPGKLYITLIEHKGIARWQNDGIVHQDNEIIFTTQINNANELPTWVGDPKNIKLYSKLYRLLKSKLSVTPNKIINLDMSDLNSIKVTLSNGIILYFEQQSITDSLSRLLTVYRNINKSHLVHLSYLDARYRHGIAIGWKNSLTKSILSLGGSVEK